MKLECTKCGAYWTAHTPEAKAAAKCICGGAGVDSEHAPRPKGPPRPEAKAACPGCGKRYTDSRRRRCECGTVLWKRRERR